MITDHVQDGGELTDFMDKRAQPLFVAWLAAHRPSAHGDVGDALLRGADAACVEWTAFSPSYRSFMYVALITRRRAFALAWNMQTVSLCLADPQVAVALAQGCALHEELGTGWVRFDLWLGPTPRPDLKFFLRAAYAHAHALAPPPAGASA
ncbi:MAG: hypothetical protein HY275_12735 [Gemmatimonadetes bacterium]|nr:hypothetical protein [Gemmatimonadota bacterium]